MPRTRLLACFAVAFGLLGTGDALAADGDLYTGFSGDGRLQTDLGAAFDVDNPNDSVLDSSGRIVVIGQADSEIGVARIYPDGSLDSTFGGGDGKVILDSGASASGEVGRAVTIDAGGKIVVLGRAGAASGIGTDLVLARLDTDGNLDPAFDGPNLPAGNGIFRLDFSTNDEATDIAIKGTKLVIAATQGNTDPVAAITQLNADGTPDTAGFGGGTGTFTFTWPGGGPGTGSFLFSMAVQSDGKIVA